MRQCIINIFQMNSEALWKKEQSMLQEEASNISTLKKEITKQTQIDASVQLTIGQKIDYLKQNATLLTNRLQNEKHKNAELQTIIRYIQGKMEKEKLEEATHRDDINFDSLTSLENRYKKLEYDLSQTNSKVNRLSENVQQKRIKINQNRMERVIDSGIFRNIEKELIDSELKFKKLLIEKIKFEREYQKLLKEYNGFKQKAESYNTSQRDNLKSKSLIGEPSFTSACASSQGSNLDKKKFTVLDNSKFIVNRTGTLKKIEAQYQIEEQKQIIAVHKLLSQTGVQTPEQLLYYFDNIDSINDKYFNEMNIYTDQSNQIQKYISEIQVLKKAKKLNFYPLKKNLNKNTVVYHKCKEVKIEVNKYEDQIQKQIDQINTLLKEDRFQIFLKEVGIQTQDSKSQNELDLNYVRETLQLLENNIQQYIRPSKNVIDDKGTTSRTAKQERLQEYINKVRKMDQCGKVMKKQDFQQEYRKIVKNNSQKNLVNKGLAKRKSLGLIKK